MYFEFVYQAVAIISLIQRCPSTDRLRHLLTTFPITGLRFSETVAGRSFAIVWTAFLIRIHKSFAPNLGPNAKYTDWGFPCLLHSAHIKFRSTLWHRAKPLSFTSFSIYNSQII